MRKQISKLLVIAILTNIICGTTVVFGYPTTNIEVSIHVSETLTVEILDETENLINSVAVDDNHSSISFSYSEPGQYSYYVRQKYDSAKQYEKFDDTMWQVVLVVTNVENVGQLDCQIILAKAKTGEKVGEIGFDNQERKEKTEEETSSPKSSIDKPKNGPSKNSDKPTTGDWYSRYFLWISLIAVFAVIVLILIKKEKSK